MRTNVLPSSSRCLVARPLRAATAACAPSRALRMRVSAEVSAPAPQQKIRIKLKSYRTDLLTESVEQIKEAASSTGLLRIIGIEFARIALNLAHTVSGSRPTCLLNTFPPKQRHMLFAIQNELPPPPLSPSPRGAHSPPRRPSLRSLITNRQHHD